MAECFEQLGGVPQVVLADRIACLRGPIVADRVVAHPDYVRFAGHYGFRPDWCESADPQSKGVVENLVGYAKSDLVVPSCNGWVTLADANTAARSWCGEVNAAEHSEIAAVPAVRLTEEIGVLRPLPSLRPALTKGVSRKVDRLSTVRIGSARYSVPATLIGTKVWVAATDQTVTIRTDDDTEVAVHPLVASGEVAICDDHYGGPRTAPARAVRPRTPTEKAFVALGGPAEAFLRAAAAAGQTRLPAHLAGIVDLVAAHGEDLVVAALQRALTFRRFTADDIRSIIAAGPDAPVPTSAGSPLTGDLPDRASADLEAFSLDRLTSRRVTSVTATPAPLAADLTVGLKRLKLATIRTVAPGVLQTAKTQRWAPEELLRTLVEAEIAARTPPTCNGATKPPHSPSQRPSRPSTPRRHQSRRQRSTT